MLDPMLEVWVRGIQQKIARLDPMFTAYVNQLAANTASQNIQPAALQSILDEDADDSLVVNENNIVEQLIGIDLQLTQLLTVLDVGEPVATQPVNEAVEANEAQYEKENTQNNTLGSLLGTLKSVLPIKQTVAMWFQTEMITDPASIYYSPNIGPDAWLEHDKKNGTIYGIHPNV